jgi:hypothetical protein
MSGAGLVGGRVANSSGIHFWVWTLITLQVTSIFSLVLSARGLWSLRSGQSRQSDDPNVEARRDAQAPG